jgi:hypothetical protein
MSDPADKSDDLIAELAKLMAATPGKDSTVQPVGRPAPIAPAANAPGPAPVRIPGMDASPPPAPSTPSPQPESRAPATGTIRIPGMDQPAPVSTSAPVGKIDFGRPVSAAPLKQEPLSTLSERLAAQNPAGSSPAKTETPAPVRIPSALTPVSENRSFGEGPALSVARPSAAAASAQPPGSPPPATDFSFDFGFAQNPPTSSQPAAAAQPSAGAAPAGDPIAALIEADMSQDDGESGGPAEEDGDGESGAANEAEHTATVTPMIRPVSPATSGPARPTIAPVASAGARPVNHAPIPLKPVTAPPRAPESDRFAISPGVGLNMKPPASQPLNAPAARTPAPAPQSDDSDPMSEIESLIGEAVRVELSPGPVKVQTAQSVAPKVELEPEEEIEREIAQHTEPEPPVVPPLTKQFAPRRANLKDDRSARSAEEAILAATAASGSDVGHLEPSIGDESPYRRLKVRPQRSGLFSGGLRQYVGMAVAGTLLLAAGLGLYWVLNMGRPSSTGANAPQLTADATPVKAKPVETSKPSTDTAKSPVLAKMDGDSAPPSAEQLVSTEASAVDVTRDVTPVADDTESGLANRKVRTVTVRPDGTIVSGDDAVAGGEALPIDRPNVPSVPSAAGGTNLLGNEDSPTSEALLPSNEQDAGTPLAPGANPGDTQVAEAEQPVMDPTQVAPVPMPFPVRAAARPTANAPTNTAVNALVGAETPNGQIDLLGGGTAIAPKPTPAVAEAAPAPAAGPTPAAYVQLSSQPSAADAQASVKVMTARYGSLFGGNKLVVQQVDLGQKGIRWRVRLPAASLADAANICAQIKAQGGDCFATNS